MTEGKLDSFKTDAVSLNLKVLARWYQGAPLQRASPQIEYHPHGWQISATQL